EGALQHLSDGAEAEGRRERGGADEAREERQAALVREPGEHVDEEDPRVRPREQGTNGGGPILRRLRGRGRKTDGYQEGRGQERWTDEEPGGETPGPSRGDRGRDVRRTGRDPEAATHPVPSHPASLLAHGPRDDGQPGRMVDPGEQAEGHERRREKRDRGTRRNRRHRCRDAHATQKQEPAPRAPVRPAPERNRAQATGAGR